MKVYIVYCLQDKLHVEGVFTHMEKLEKIYKDLGYIRKGMCLYLDGECHYKIEKSELIGQISYSGVKQLHDGRWF